jgi:hypothetical protein
MKKTGAFLAVFSLLPAAAGLYADAAAFAAVDARALSAPASAEASVDRLASYLGQWLSSDVEKARAAWRWVTDNIAYDTDAFFTGRFPSMDAGSVLSSGKSVCAGYSSLYAELCRRMGLTVQSIHGYAKGWGYAPGAVIGASNHDWNAVMVDGAWRLVDATWGAGYVGGDRRFARKYTEFFFLSPPDRFILSHLPEDPKWQLLPRPWSAQEFSDAVYVFPPAYTLGVVARSHLKSVFPSTGRETLVFDAPPGVVAMASVDGAHDLTLCQAVDGGFEVRCAFPDARRSTVRIYATDDPGSSYAEVMEYAVEARSTLGDAAGFPLTYGNYGPRKIRLRAPLAGRLKAGSSVDFDLSAPGAASVMVVSGSDRALLTRDGDAFTGSVKAAQGSIQVFAQYPGSASYEGILSYQGK